MSGSLFVPVVLINTSVLHFAMATYEQFTQYDVELKVPEQAVQELDESVRKGTHRVPNLGTRTGQID